MPILETERLRMRPLVLEDLDALHEVQRDDESMRFYGGGFARETSLDWIQRTQTAYAEHGFALAATELRESGQFVGLIGITYQPVDGEQLPEIGYQIHPQFQGQVFDLFFRGNPQSVGNGVGLYLVKQSVDRLGGKIGIESEEGAFTRMYVKIPWAG